MLIKNSSIFEKSCRSGFALNMLDVNENYDDLCFCLNKYLLVVGPVVFLLLIAVCFLKLLSLNARCAGVNEFLSVIWIDFSNKLELRCAALSLCFLETVCR